MPVVVVRWMPVVAERSWEAGRKEGGRTAGGRTAGDRTGGGVE